MEMIKKQAFVEKGAAALSLLWDELNGLDSLPFASLDREHTLFVIVDMVNGFVKEGPLSSPRVLNIVSPIRDLLLRFREESFPVVAFADTHRADSPEFSTYSPHCLENTSESEIINELQGEDHYLMIRKNSTNGFLEKEFQQVLFTNPQISTFVVTGCCTDICVMQFCLTLKTFFNMQNRVSRIIVPADCVETFEFGSHDGGLMNAVPFKLMQNAGVELVKSIH